MEFRTVENGCIECTINSGYLAFTLDPQGNVDGVYPKGIFHCTANDLIDLGDKVKELKGEVKS